MNNTFDNILNTRALIILNFVYILFLFLPIFAIGQQSPTDSFAKSMVWIDGGTFQMGNENGFSDEKPVHPVTLDGFYMDQFEVTNSQYATFMNLYKSEYVKKGIYEGQTLIYEHVWGIQKINDIWIARQGYESHPVVMVSWYGALEFAQFYGKRLPSEEEWEYAARKGLVKDDIVSIHINLLNEVGWYLENSNNHTHPVGMKIKDNTGLYDLLGNVYEWCQRSYIEEYYQKSLEDDLLSYSWDDYASDRIMRGGSWRIEGRFCQPTHRGYGLVQCGFSDVGFRCVKDK